MESERFASALDLDTYERISWRPEEPTLKQLEDSLSGVVPIPPKRRKHLQKECYNRLGLSLGDDTASCHATESETAREIVYIFSQRS